MFCSNALGHKRACNMRSSSAMAHQQGFPCCTNLQKPKRLSPLNPSRSLPILCVPPSPQLRNGSDSILVLELPHHSHLPGALLTRQPYPLFQLHPPPPRLPKPHHHDRPHSHTIPPPPPPYLSSHGPLPQHQTISITRVPTFSPIPLMLPKPHNTHNDHTATATKRPYHNTPPLTNIHARSAACRHKQQHVLLSCHLKHLAISTDPCPMMLIAPFPTLHALLHKPKPI